VPCSEFKEEEMTFTKILGVVAAAAMALMAFASAASATTLEVGGVKQNAAVTVHATLKAGSSAILKDTGGAFANTCRESTVEARTSALTGATVSAPISSLTFSSCTEEPVVVDAPGSIIIENIAGTTNGTLVSTGGKITTPSPFGALTCTTTNTHMGSLTGVASPASHATMDINAVLYCGFFLPSVRWEGTYTVTSPTGLGVTS
jgi:hypothetical protein